MAIMIFFGVPGSGKTTHAARIVSKNLRHGIPTFSNVPIKGAYKYTTSDLGRFMIEDCDLIIDEAGIQFNNRAYKSLSQEVILFLKLYRHFGIRNIYVYSQSYDDMDITIRRLSDVVFVLRRTAIRSIFAVRQIDVKVGIDEEKHCISDLYFWKRFSLRLFWGRPYWRLFDSWARPQLPAKEFQVFGKDTQS